MSLNVTRRNAKVSKGEKFGGFRDPWWEKCRFGNPDLFKIPGKERAGFPYVNDKGGPHRPVENEAWATKFHKTGKKLRGYYQWSHYFCGHAPKPHWAMNQVDQKTGTRKYMGGMVAKPVWCPPKKRQREAMERTHEVEHETIPMEFMETYSRLNNRYQEELEAVRDFCFHQFVEPVVVEEEAIAQLQLFVRKNPRVKSAKMLRELEINAAEFPVRHLRLVNWYSHMRNSIDEEGRGKILVHEQIKFVQSAIKDISELTGNAGSPLEIRDLTRRIDWNELRNEHLNTEFSARLQAKQIEVMEEQEKEIKEVLRIQEKRQKQQEKHFKEWTEQAQNFIYTTNVDEKIADALEHPVTSNQPVDSQGISLRGEAKVFTTEDNYRLTPTEEEYFIIRKMKEEQRLKGNLDLEEHLTKVDEEFDLEQKKLANQAEAEKSENSTMDSMAALEMDALLEK